MTHHNASLTGADRAMVLALDHLVRRPEVQRVLQRAYHQACAQLRLAPDAPSDAVAIDPALLGAPLPPGVSSARVVATRGAGSSDTERHQNSIQYLCVLDAPIRTHVLTEHGWRIDEFGHGGDALEDRWHVVPMGAWHRSESPGADIWGVIALHSARDVSDEFRSG